MTRTANRAKVALVAVAFLLTLLPVQAGAQSSLGIGTAETPIQPGGFLSGFFQWVNAWQVDFYRQLTGALRAMRDDGGAAWGLVGVSFLYGIFHAAGPGHGKVVISSYMLANEVALRRGIVLSFVSAMLQAASAILMIGAVYFILRGTSVSMTSATWALEVASYALVAAFGAMLLWTKLRAPLASLVPQRRMALAANRPNAALHSLFDRQTETVCDGPPAGGTVLTGRADVFCEDCGRSHAVDPEKLGGTVLDLRSAWAAVLAVGIRPCSGALIVLSFALLNSLWLGGLLSVLAMSLGTALTVSVLAVLSVGAKDVALRLARGTGAAARLRSAIEISGALALLLIGLTLLGGSLSN